MKLFQQRSLVRQLYLLFLGTVLLITAALCMFYSVSLGIIRDKESQYMRSITGQIAEKAEDVTTAIELLTRTVSRAPAAKHLLEQTNSAKKWEYKQSLNNLIAEMAKSNSNINNILLMDKDGSVYGFSGFDYLLVSKLNSRYDLFSAEKYANGFSGAICLSTEGPTYYTCVKPIYDDSAETTRIGSCLVVCGSEALIAACEQAAPSENAFFAILDGDNQVLSSSRPLDAAACVELTQMLGMESSELFSARIGGERFLLIQYPTQALTGWKVIGAVPYREIYSGMRRFQFLALAFVFVLCFAMFALVRQIITNITKPLLKIADFVQRGPYYTLHHHLKVDDGNEIESIGTGINSMLDEINDLNCRVLQDQSRLYEIELANNQARLLALQSQINPHFINNTLGAIQGMAYQKRYDSICTAISALAYIMHYSISGADLVTIDEEMLSVEQYLRIIELRFPSRFQICLEIDDRIRQCVMPRFLLQPLVENAVSHGLEPHCGCGKLTLSGRMGSDEVIRFACVDDGVGIPPEKLKALNDMLQAAKPETEHSTCRGSGGIGLRNIHLRLQLVYGPSYGITVSAAAGGGTAVYVEFPASSETKTERSG